MSRAALDGFVASLKAGSIKTIDLTQPLSSDTPILTGRFGLQCLCNLDRLPPTGAVIVSAPLKIVGGSGSPLRVPALVAG